MSKFKKRTLKELTGDLLADLRKRKRIQDLKSCKTLADYVAMGFRYNYKPNWAYIQWGNRKSWLESHGYRVPTL